MGYHVFRFLDISPKDVQEHLNREEKLGFFLADFHDDEGYVTVITHKNEGEHK